MASVVALLIACADALQMSVAAQLAHSLRAGRDIAVLVCALLCAAALAVVIFRVHQRRRRAVARYQLVLSQSDEAAFEDVASAYEQLVQTVRAARIRRSICGQPWLAIESWFVPAEDPGETGTAALMVLCEPSVRESALAALRHAYPDLTMREAESRAVGDVESLPQAFVADHVMRVRKARSWALAIGSANDRRDASNARSTMADIIRQQQKGERLSCVRWCLVPAAERLDSRATQKLENMDRRRRGAAISNDVAQASRTAGGAMCFLELQAAVRSRSIRRRGRARRESLMALHTACRQLLAPALSQRGANHLRERMMLIRQDLYRRRWLRAEPPVLPDSTGATLVSPRELAMLMALPSLGSEHALPLQRNTVPHLPIPVDVPRARMVDLPEPTATVTALRSADRAA